MCQSLAGLAVSATCALGQDEARAAGDRGSTVAGRILPPPPAEWMQTPGPGVGGKRVDTQTMRRLQGEADRLYRDSAAHAADTELIRLYEAMAKAAPRRASHAWLRIGNIHQRAGAVGPAIDAYRQTLRAASAEDTARPDEEDSRRKALLNLASLAIDQARQALSQLTALPAAAVHLGHLERLAEQIDGEALPSSGSRTGGPRAEGSGAAAGPRLREPPYIVERYTASGRRNAVKSAKGSLHIDPADELPAKPVPKPRSRPREKLPQVEYLLGDPQRFKPAADAHAFDRDRRKPPGSGKPAAPGQASTSGDASGDGR
jgi:hypothetical protein